MADDSGYNTDKELREMRGEIAEMLNDIGYTTSAKSHSLRNLSKDGVSIAGPFGGMYSMERGLLIWNKAQRNSGKRFTISELRVVEQALTKKFCELISTGRLK